jgi:hypothetical protein
MGSKKSLTSPHDRKTKLPTTIYSEIPDMTALNKIIKNSNKNIIATSSKGAANKNTCEKIIPDIVINATGTNVLKHVTSTSGISLITWLIPRFEAPLNEKKRKQSKLNCQQTDCSMEFVAQN